MSGTRTQPATGTGSGTMSVSVASAAAGVGFVEFLGIADTLQGSSHATAPGAGATIANTPANLPAGVYEVQVQTWAAAETDPTKIMNMGLRNGAAVVISRLASIAAPATIGRIRFTSDGTAQLSVVALAAATAASEYAAVITVTRLS